MVGHSSSRFEGLGAVHPTKLGCRDGDYEMCDDFRIFVVDNKLYKSISSTYIRTPEPSRIWNRRRRWRRWRH